LLRATLHGHVSMTRRRPFALAQRKIPQLQTLGTCHLALAKCFAATAHIYKCQQSAGDFYIGLKL
jgi:hypothetical protein